MAVEDEDDDKDKKDDDVRVRGVGDESDRHMGKGRKTRKTGKQDYFLGFF